MATYSNGDSFKIGGTLKITDGEGWVIGADYGKTASFGTSHLIYAECSTSLSDVYIPSVGVPWTHEPPKPDILECMYCGSPFERRNAAGALNSVCNQCGAPLSIKVRESGERGKVVFQDSEWEDPSLRGRMIRYLEKSLIRTLRA